MNYIKKMKDKIEVDGKIINISLTRYLESLANKNFKTISSIRKNTIKYLKIKRNIPLYINESILLVPLNGIKATDSFLFNYKALSKYLINEDNLILFFKDKSITKLEVSRYRSRNCFEKVKIVCEYCILID